SGAKAKPSGIRHIAKGSDRGPKVVDAADPNGQSPIHVKIYTSSRRHSKAVGLVDVRNLGMANPGVKLVPFRQVAAWNSLRKDSFLVELLAAQKSVEVERPSIAFTVGESGSKEVGE